MPALSAGDLTKLRAGNYGVRRYVSICPRDAVYQAQINAAPVTDSKGSIIELTLDTASATGNAIDLWANYTVEIGTTAGARDIGTTRLRVGSLHTNNIKIAETGPSELPVENGHYVTVRRERRIWQRLQRLVGIDLGRGYPTEFEVYKDYDYAYGVQNHTHFPLANVDYRPAGWVDSGQTYRTLTLDASGSEPVSHLSTISSYLWSLPTGVALVAGYALTDAVIEVQADAGFHEITLYVTDSNGMQTSRWCYVWAHDATYPPLVNFAVTRDETEDWREMDLEFYDDGTVLNTDDLPEGTQVCYWEDVTFNGQTAPDQYRDQMLGWLLNDAVDLRKYRSGLRVTVAGVGGHLARIAGPSDSMLYSTSPTRWHEMSAINDNRLIAYLLRWHTTALDVCNLHLLDKSYEWGDQNIDYANIWDQMKAIAQGSIGVPGCDSLSGIWLRRHPCYMTDAERAANPVTMALTSADWGDDDGLIVNYERGRRVGKVKGGGFVSMAGSSYPLASQAPGDASSYGLTVDEPKAWALDPVNSQEELNRITGCHYGYLNNQLPEVTLRLMTNFDAAEPAWREWVTVSYSDDNVRGITWVNKRFLLKRVSVAHGSSPRDVPREVTLTLESETDEHPGVTAEVPQEGSGVPGDYTPPDYSFPPLDPALGPGLNNILLVHESGEISYTSDFKTKSANGGPSFTVDDLSLEGDVCDAVTDPYSPKYLGTGSTVDLWIATTKRIYHVANAANVGGGRVVTSQHTFAAETPYRTIQTERGVQNWVIVASYYAGGGVKACRTTDGSTWTEVTVTSGLPSGGSYQVGWTTTHSTFPTPGEHGSFSLSVSDSTLTASWSRNGAQWNDCGLQVTVNSAVSVTSIKWRARRLELNPTASGEWTLPGNSYANLKSLLLPNGVLAGVAETNDGTWAIFTKTWDTPQTLSYFRSIGGGWRGNPNPTGSPCTNNIEFEILEVNGEANSVGNPSRPQVYVSGKVAGLCYITAFSGGVARLYKSINYGATWTLTNLPASDFGYFLGGGLHFPWHDNTSEFLYYWGKFDGSDYHAYRTEADGTTKTVITPAAGYGPAGPKAWSTSATNRLVTALMATNGTNVAGWLSVDGGDTRAQILPAMPLASGYTGVHVADDTGVLYLYGPGGVAYTGAGGLSRDDRTGDASSSPVVAIGGW